jgi:hypothetical protein
MVIGAFTGIYVLLSTYAAFGLTIVGVAFAAYKAHRKLVKTFVLP